ncbi:cupin domain-containing protein [Aidingimonas lacisalsi]|uniref:cupin domain-containing protein n=1 Tax=Aidingimonas lacisalsi TaxID=2604086 RepID=UPI0011D28A9E|nr:cupin domain-containing protein [Aidingimonas lacisalsi]
MSRIQQLIDHYRLQPHPEGGHFVQVFQSRMTLNSPVNGAIRTSATHIYFLLQNGERSRFHQVLHDELWHVYEGAPLRLIRGDGQRFDATTIGAGCDDYFAVVHGGQWQGAESTGDYTLCGCTVAPGFDFEDFTMMSDAQARQVPPDWQHFV